MKKIINNENEFQIEPEFTSRRAGAKFLGISLAKFDQLKDLEFIKYGKRKLFAIKTLREYAEKHTVRKE